MPHSAKNPSAKVSLSSATYRALGKAFVECHVSTRQKKSDVNSDGLFAECHLSVTRQRIFSFFLKILCRVPYYCTRQRNFFVLKKIFVKCHGSGTRQSWEIGSLLPSFAECHGLSSVALGKEGEMLFFWFFAFHQHKQRNHIYINTQHRIYHIHIHIPSHTHP